MKLAQYSTFLHPETHFKCEETLNGLCPRRQVFDPGSIHVGFVMGEVELGQVFPRILRFAPVELIPPVLHYTEKGNANHLHHRVAQ
jgi:hypothetical protein